MDNPNRRIYHVSRRTAEKAGSRNRSMHSFLAAAALCALLVFVPDSRINGELLRSAAEAAVRLCQKAVTADIIGAVRLRPLSTAGIPDVETEPEDFGAQISSHGAVGIPSGENEEIYSDELFLPAPDEECPQSALRDVMQKADGIITEVTYGHYTGEDYIDLDGGGQIRNLTSLPDEDVYRSALAGLCFDVETNTSADEPQILIMHTHTTESYEPYRKGSYDADVLSRTTDSRSNMVAVGERMAEVFRSCGISTLHDETIHDHPSYNGSYDRSRVTVKKLLEKYPSIKLILDVHRDAIERDNGERIAPTTEINGRSAAQVMIICGCTEGADSGSECIKNLRTAAFMQVAMESTYPTLTRPLLFDYRGYNQDLSAGSLLIEVGGHGNSLDQALYAGELAADAIGKALSGKQE